MKESCASAWRSWARLRSTPACAAATVASAMRSARKSRSVGVTGRSVATMVLSASTASPDMRSTRIICPRIGAETVKTSRMRLLPSSSTTTLRVCRARTAVSTATGRGHKAQAAAASTASNTAMPAMRRSIFTPSSSEIEQVAIATSNGLRAIALAISEENGLKCCQPEGCRTVPSWICKHGQNK